ncbi:MAG: hypothetical protein JWN26_837 [Candidatus Saccharibacteria bacterium]|nr:hypothetical protein [Candidatus Saccharibacteria bacterium]
MTEPTGELFAAANSTRKKILAEQATQRAQELTQVARQSDTENRQRIIDQKKAADKIQSDERAQAFIEIMRAHNIEPIAVYKPTMTFRGGKSHHVGGPNFKDSRSYYVPEYNRIYADFGKGWVISKKNDPTGEYFTGRILLEALETFDFNPKWSEENKVVPQDTAVALAQNFTPPPTYRQYYGGHYIDKAPLEAPYAGETGLALLGSALLMYNIVNQESTVETTE